MEEELNNIGPVPDSSGYEEFLQYGRRKDHLGRTFNNVTEFEDKRLVGNEYDEFNKYDAGLSYGNDQNINRSSNQDGFTKGLRAAARLPLGIVTEAINTAAYGSQLLLDPEATMTGDIKNFNPLTQALLNFGKDVEGVNDGIISMYTKDSGVFDPGDSNWWAKTIEGWGPTFGMMVGSLGAGLIAKIPGAIGKTVAKQSIKKGIRKELGDVFEANVDDLIKIRGSKGVTDKLGKGVSDGLFNQSVKLSDDGLAKLAQKEEKELLTQAVANAQKKYGKEGASFMERAVNKVIDTPDQTQALQVARQQSEDVANKAVDIFQEQLRRSGQSPATAKELRAVFEKAKKESYEDLYKVIKAKKKRTGPTQSQIDEELALLKKADAEEASIDYQKLLEERRVTVKKMVDDYIKTNESVNALDSFGQAAVASVISRNAETLGEAKDTYDIVYARSKELHPERTEAEHKEVASLAASKNYAYGMSLTVVDMLQYTKLLSLFKGAGSFTKGMNSKLKESLKLFAFDAASEGVEEGLQYTFSKNSQAITDESLVQSFLNATGDKEFWDSVVQGSIGGLAFASPGYIKSMLSKDPSKPGDTAIQKAEALSGKTSTQAIEAAKKSTDLDDQSLANTAQKSKDQGDDPDQTKNKVLKKALELDLNEARDIIVVAQKALKSDPVFGKDAELIMTKLSLTQASNLPEDTKEQKEVKDSILKSYREKLDSLIEKPADGKTAKSQIENIEGVPGVDQIRQALLTQLTLQQKQKVLELENNKEAELPETNYEVGDDSGMQVNANFEIYKDAEKIANEASTTKEAVEKFVLFRAFERLNRNPDEGNNRELMNIIVKQLGDEIIEINVLKPDGKPAYDSQTKKKLTTLQLKNTKDDVKIENTIRNTGASLVKISKDYIANLSKTDTSPTSSNPSEEHHLTRLSLNGLEKFYNDAESQGGNSKLPLDEIYKRSQLKGSEAIKALRLFNKLNGGLTTHSSVIQLLRDLKPTPLYNLLIDVIESMGMDMQIVFTAAGRRGVYDKENNTVYLNKRTLQEEANNIFKDGSQKGLIGDAKTEQEFRKKYMIYNMIKTLIRNEIINNPTLASDPRLISIFNNVPKALLDKYQLTSLKEMLMEFGNGAFVYELSKIPMNTNYSLGSVLREILNKIIELVTGNTSNAYAESVSVLHELMTGEPIVDKKVNNLRRTKTKSKIDNTRSVDDQGTVQHLEIHTLPYRIVTVSNAQIETLANGDEVITGGSFRFPNNDEGAGKTISYAELTKDYNFAITSNNTNGKYTVMLLDKNDKPVLNTVFAEKYGIDLEYYQTLDLTKEDELTVVVDQDQLGKNSKEDKETGKYVITNYDAPVLKVQHNGKTIGIIQGGNVDRGPLKEFRKRFLDNAIQNPKHSVKLNVRRTQKGDFLQTSVTRRLSEVIPSGMIPTIKVINNAAGTGKSAGIVDKNTIKIGDRLYRGKQDLTEQTSNIVVFLDGPDVDSGTYFIADAVSFKNHPELTQALIDALLREKIDLEEIRSIVKWSINIDGKKISQPSVDSFFKVAYTKKKNDTTQEGDIIVDSPSISLLMDTYHKSKKTDTDRTLALDELQDAQEGGEIFRVKKINGANMTVELLDMDLKPTGVTKEVPTVNKNNYYSHYVSQFMNDHDIMERPVQVSLEDTYETAKDKIETNILPKVLMAPTRLFTSEVKPDAVDSQQASVEAATESPKDIKVPLELSNILSPQLRTPNELLKELGIYLKQFEPNITFIRYSKDDGGLIITINGKEYVFSARMGQMGGSNTYLTLNDDSIPNLIDEWKKIQTLNKKVETLDTNIDDFWSSDVEALASIHSTLDPSEETETLTSVINQEVDNSREIKTFVKRFANRLRKSGYEKTDKELTALMSSNPDEVIGKLKEIGLPQTDSGKALVKKLSNKKENVLDQTGDKTKDFLASLGFPVTDPNCTTQNK